MPNTSFSSSRSQLIQDHQPLSACSSGQQWDRARHVESNRNTTVFLPATILVNDTCLDHLGNLCTLFRIQGHSFSGIVSVVDLRLTAAVKDFRPCCLAFGSLYSQLPFSITSGLRDHTHRRARSTFTVAAHPSCHGADDLNTTLSHPGLGSGVSSSLNGNCSRHSRSSSQLRNLCKSIKSSSTL